MPRPPLTEYLRQVADPTTRGEIYIDGTLAAAFSEKTRARRNGSALVNGWIVAAGRAARAGHGDLLPRRPTSGRRDRGGVPTTPVKFTPVADHDDLVEAIEDAGSSVVDVVEEAVRSWLDAKCSLLTMRYPGEPVAQPQRLAS